jgi:hypothetical protein
MAVKTGSGWFLEIPDKEWYGIGDDARATYLEEQKTIARAKGCTSLIIVAVPDPIFPLYGHTKRHRVHLESWPSDDAPAFKIETEYTGYIHVDVWNKLSEKGRVDLTRSVRDALNARGEVYAGRYSIYVTDSVTQSLIEKGRV